MKNVIIRYIRIGLLNLCLIILHNGAMAGDIVKVIFYPDSMKYSCEKIMLLRDGIFALDGTSIVALENNNTRYDLPIPKRKSVDEIISTKFGDVIKAGKDLFLLNDTLTLLMSFDKDKYNIYPYQGDMIYVSYSDSKYNYLCGINIVNNQIGEILKLDETIISVSHIDSKLFVTTKTNLYMFNNDGKCVRLLSAWEPFRSSVLTSNGILIGTDNSISLIVDEETFIPLIKTGCKKMYYGEDNLYIYTPDNALLRINFKEAMNVADINSSALYLFPDKVMIEIK